MIRAFLAALAFVVVLTAPARALTLLRDADMEYALRQLSAPVLTAAGLAPSQVRVLVVDDRSLNAFVADTSHIFLHSGLISALDTAGQLQAVIAHEAAHIASGHIAARRGNAGTAHNAAGLGLLLAAAAAASGSGDLGLAVAAGSQGSAMRRFFSHTRAEESSADISSVRILLRAGIDPRHALSVQQLFEGQVALPEGRQDPYMRSHPLTRDRLRALRALVETRPETPPDPTAQYWFARMQGKLTAFQRAPGWTLRRASDSPSRDIRLMREAVAHHRNADTASALAAIDAALAARNGRDPYLLELKGQIQLESRRFAAALATYRTAADQAPREPLILGGLGRALLATDRPEEALRVLEAARGRDFSDARILRDLAGAYARVGQDGMASVVTAERYALQGRLKDAGVHARRAEGLLARGSGPWQRAQDVIAAAERAARRER